MVPVQYLVRPLPEALQGLADLAMDLRWHSDHEADELWRSIDTQLWDATGNPWLILIATSTRRLEALARDAGFIAELNRLTELRRSAMQRHGWFSTAAGSSSSPLIAYFSMEFGLSEALPIYSGGLGILAGDHLKTASDMDVALAGVGLLYQQGYFRQAIDGRGRQLEFYPFNDPAMLPVLPLRDEAGEWVRVELELPGRTLYLRGWEARVGRIPLYLLDSNDPLNSPGDRGITGELYGGGVEMRLQQEMVLGIGGWRLLQALDLAPPVCHLNEGHAAFAVLERARAWMQTSAQPFAVALNCTRAGNVFTTHTPVGAGFDRFPRELMAQYFEGYAEGLGLEMDELMQLGQVNAADRSEPFNMAVLAAHGSGGINGVSRLHGEVSRRLFQPLFPRWPQPEVPVGSVTNGVHLSSWDSAVAHSFWHAAEGPDWWHQPHPVIAEKLSRVSDEQLWTMRSESRMALIHAVRRRLRRQVAQRRAEPDRIDEIAQRLDPNALTLGFARRFTGYKRPNLLLHDPARLTRLLTARDRPVQLILAGKAHPNDEEGREMVQAWSQYLRRPEVQGHVVFIEDYDMSVAREMVQGVDLWVNTPRRPWEASGTSGMKVLVNGGLNFSELDGWWAEAWDPELGWALQNSQTPGIDAETDRSEADELYRLLETEVIPAFYERDARGIPLAWVSRMRTSMARLTTRFSSYRMVREYAEQYYLPGLQRYQRRIVNHCALGVELQQWQQRIATHWPGLRFGNVEVRREGDVYHIELQAYLGEMTMDEVCVELYADSVGALPGVRQALTPGEALSGALHGYLYRGSVPADRAPAAFTPRFVPMHPEALIPLEANQIHWRE